MDFKPNLDMIAIIRDQVEDKTAAGIYLPENSKTQSNTGEVYASGARSEPYKGFALEGKRVLYNFHPGRSHEMEVNGNAYLVISIEDVIAEIP